MVTLRIADGLFTVEDTAQSTREGRPTFAWDLIVPGAHPRWHGEDLHGPVMGREPGEREMLGTLLAFIGAALESRSYRERTGREGENETLFPADMLDWCAQHSDAIQMAAFEIEGGTPDGLTSGDVAGTDDDPFE